MGRKLFLTFTSESRKTASRGRKIWAVGQRNST